MNAVTLDRPQHIASLRTSAILVSIDMQIWSATKQDRVVSDEVATAKHAHKDAGRYVKNLLANDPKHRAISNYRQTVYNWMKSHTLDWSAKMQCLPAVDLPRFMSGYKHHETEFWRLVDEFIAAYPSIVSNMAFAQGSMFDANDYPAVADLRSKFNIDLYTSEIPEGDYRVQVSQDLADDLHRNYTLQAERLMRDMHAEQKQKFIAVMESISHSCRIDVTEGKVSRGKVYETTIQRAIDMCRTLEAFNPTGDEDLEAARARLGALLSSNPYETIRSVDTVRTRVKNEVDDILSRFR